MMAQPVYSVRLDANSAKELFERGATILMLDVPEGTAVGFDHKVTCHREHVTVKT